MRKNTRNQSYYSIYGIGASRFARLFMAFGPTGGDFAVGIGPSGYWGGGHEYNQSAVLFGFNEILLPEVTEALAAQGFTGVDLQQRAKQKAIGIFNLRFSQNIRSIQREEKREQHMETIWEILEDDHGNKQLYNREYDTTLEQLLEGTRRFAEKSNKPEFYNNAEATALLHIQDELVHGRALTAAYFVSHQDGARYMPVMERRGQTVVSTHVDIGKIVGRDLSAQEAEGVIERLTARHENAFTDEASAYPYVLTKETLDISEVHIVALVQAMISSDIVEQTKSERTVSDYKPQEESVSELQVNDPTESQYTSDRHPFEDLDNVPSGQNFLVERATIENEYGQKAQEMGRVISSISSEAGGISQKVASEMFNSSVSLGTFMLKKFHDRKKIAGLKSSQKPLFRSESITVDKTNGKPSLMREEIDQDQADVKNPTMALAVAIKTVVAHGAAPLLLVFLAKELQKPITAVDKSIARHRNKEARKLRTRNLVNMNRFIDSSVVKGRAPERLGHLPERPRQLRKKKTKEVFAKKELLNASRRERRGNQKRKELLFLKKSDKKRSQKEKFLTRKDDKPKRKQQDLGLIRLAGRLLRAERRKFHDRPVRRKDITSFDKVKTHPQKGEQPVSRKELALKQKEAVLVFSFGALVLALIRMRRIGQTIMAEEVKPKNVSETLITPEPTQWILLSIIWYLSMIREQGKNQGISNNKYVTGNKKQSKQLGQLIHNAGVIFVYPT